jgi:hypothetical protein
MDIDLKFQEEFISNIRQYLSQDIEKLSEIENELKQMYNIS